MKIIPAIDLKNGSCVRLYKGDFSRTTEYSNDPVEVGRRFGKLAVDDLHIVDLDGARTGTQRHHALVRELAAETGLDIQLGGGIRTRGAVAAWLEAGVARCVIGSIAIEEPATAGQWIDEFGSDAVVLALDVRIDSDGQPLLTTQGWTEDSALSLWECLDLYRQAKVRHVLCTDVSRDGAMAGPNLDLYAEILARFPTLQLQASGGVRHIADLDALRSIKVPAAITGRALLDGKITASEVESFRQSA